MLAMCMTVLKFGLSKLGAIRRVLHFYLGTTEYLSMKHIHAHQTVQLSNPGRQLCLFRVAFLPAELHYKRGRSQSSLGEESLH